MKRVTVIVSGVIASVMAASAAFAEPGPTRRPSEFNGPYMRVFGPSQPPYGYVRYCEQQPESCASSGAEMRFEATPERLSDLDHVNRNVNQAVQPATDNEIYGVSEYWTLPGERGDCEDYALLKQKLLVSRGWPSSSLLLTVVRDEKGEGHAVLTARTSQGDFVLDNKVEDVKLWNRSGYEYVMRQSYLDPRVWVSLDPTDATSPASLAGVSDRR